MRRAFSPRDALGLPLWFVHLDGLILVTDLGSGEEGPRTVALVVTLADPTDKPYVALSDRDRWTVSAPVFRPSVGTRDLVPLSPSAAALAQLELLIEFIGHRVADELELADRWRAPGNG